jgi:hypothetical protein
VDGNYATLPAATTVGQTLTLLDTSPTGAGFFLDLNANDFLYNEAASYISSKGQHALGPFGSILLISDGSHNWWASYSN